MDKKKVKNQDKIVKEAFEEILKSLGIEGEFEIAKKDDGFEVVLSTEDSGIVIGHHGDTLEALQIISSAIISKKLGEFKRISIEVGDYKKNREDWLRSLALSTKERVVQEGKEIYLPDLKPWERRIVHLVLQDDSDVLSESVGEGKERVLVIKPKA